MLTNRRCASGVLGTHSNAFDGEPVLLVAPPTGWATIEADGSPGAHLPVRKAARPLVLKNRRRGTPRFRPAAHALAEAEPATVRRPSAPPRRDFAAEARRLNSDPSDGAPDAAQGAGARSTHRAGNPTHATSAAGKDSCTVTPKPSSPWRSPLPRARPSARRARCHIRTGVHRHGTETLLRAHLGSAPRLDEAIYRNGTFSQRRNLLAHSDARPAPRSADRSGPGICTGRHHPTALCTVAAAAGRTAGTRTGVPRQQCLGGADANFVADGLLIGRANHPLPPSAASRLATRGMPAAQPRRSVRSSDQGRGIPLFDAV